MYSTAFVVDKVFETESFRFTEIEFGGKIQVSKFTKRYAVLVWNKAVAPYIQDFSLCLYF